MQANTIELNAPLTRAMHDGADRIGDITADAFRNDPFNRWLFGNFRAMEIAFIGLARHLYTRRGFCYRLGDEGAAMWMLPGGDSSLPLITLPTLLRSIMASSRGGFTRIRRTTEAMEAHHPQFPHAYLFTIGVRQTAQGKGLGRELFKPMLEACDREGVPAYLENSNPENRGFYNAHGFERVEMIYPVEGCPPLEAMLRKPR
ncbi:GNAT family N-acetyltransferase [Altererythrobacter sp.]|uniref:GNAT family N-acetyltransferase n=1 Tax=Altererythrobacter sp. TaxID=1872480 RepID=UPI003D054D42